jgi:hypothetical protein
VGALGAAGATVAATRSAEAASTAVTDKDWLAIRAVVDGIDDAVDAKNWAKARTYFTTEIDVDFAALEGGPPTRMPADSLITAWQQNLYADKLSFHQRTNHDIAVQKDQATVVSKGYAFNRLDRLLGDALWEVWAVYHHELVRTRDGWRCSAIALAEVIHARGNELARTYVPPS